MIQLILLIVGIGYAVRWPKLKALTAEQFPSVPPEAFAEWQALELKSMSLFLWATWGLLLIGTPILYVFAQSYPDGALGFQVVYLLLFLILLAFSSVPGSKAASLKKLHHIPWPK